MKPALSVGMLIVIASVVAAGTRFPAGSTFEAELDGWTFPPETIEWAAIGGHPGGYLLGNGPTNNGQNPENLNPVAAAPASFLGDWTALDGVAELSFELRRVDTFGGTVISRSPISVTISGPGGAATWIGPMLNGNGPTPWVTYVAPVSPSSFDVTEGTWLGLMQNVTALKIPLELVSNTLSPDDEHGLDNVLLELRPGQCAGDADCDGDVDFFDIDPFVAKLGCPGSDPVACGAGCAWHNADVDADGDVDFFDIDPFVARLGAMCP